MIIILERVVALDRFPRTKATILCGKELLWSYFASLNSNVVLGMNPPR